MGKLTKKQINEATRVKHLHNNHYSFNFDFNGRKFESTIDLPGTMELFNDNTYQYRGPGDTKKEFINSVYETLTETNI